MSVYLCIYSGSGPLTSLLDTRIQTVLTALTDTVDI